jgi:hypothetical protein
MLLTLLLAGDSSPFSGVFTLLFASLALFMLAGIGLLIAGVQMLRQENSRKLGYWFIGAAVAVPVLGFLACW